MLAIPLDTKHSTTISKLYGNAPFFALLDMGCGTFSVLENKECGNGIKTAEFISATRATKTIYLHMGEGVYKSLVANCVEVYATKNEATTIDDIYINFENQKFQKLDSHNYKDLLDSGTTSCKCGCAK